MTRFSLFLPNIHEGRFIPMVRRRPITSFASASKPNSSATTGSGWASSWKVRPTSQPSFPSALVLCAADHALHARSADRAVPSHDRVSRLALSRPPILAREFATLRMFYRAGV